MNLPLVFTGLRPTRPGPHAAILVRLKGSRKLWASDMQPTLSTSLELELPSRPS